MATSNSNSTVGSYVTARTSPSQGLMLLLHLAEELESIQGTDDGSVHGFAWTLSSSSAGSTTSSSTSSTDVSTKSQVTVSAPSLVTPYLAARFGNLTVPTAAPVRPSYGSMEKDDEGIETRKQMLARRRKECAAEEVDVALAPVMKVAVPYVFYPEQYKRFRQLFPRISVDSGLAYTHHDHPVAHTATLVGIRKMQSMLEPGEMVLDLHGNPNGNEKFNDFQASRTRKRPNLPKPPYINTLVEERTAADAVRRVTKWGAPFRGGVPRYIESPLEDIPQDTFHTFLSAHTLYYYSMYEVCKLLNKNPRSKMIALVNYSKEQSGTLYGELKFSKQGGMTTQFSPNGESYCHPDIDQWFMTNSFRGLTENVDSGISWTSTCIGGPMYILTITRCDWGLARNKRYDPPSAPTLKVSEDRKFFFGMVRLNGSDVRLRITNAGLASELRHFMTFRDRSNPQTFLDLCVKARRATGVDLVEGTRQFEIADGDLQDHIVYAYLVDAPGELELLEGVKLLRGDLLMPHAEAMRLEGINKKVGYFEPFLRNIVGRNKPAQALKSRNTPKGIGITHVEPNTAGLLPITRT